MKRRTLLATGGIALTAGLAGCIGDSDDSGASPEDDATSDVPENGDEGNKSDDGVGVRWDEVPEYADELEKCHLISLQYRSFPAEIQAEIDAALEGEGYDSETLLFDLAVDTTQSYVVKNDTPYDPTVESDGERKTLELTAVDAIHHPEPYGIRIENSDEQEYTVELQLEHSDGSEKREATVTVSGGEEKTVETTATKFGRYSVMAGLDGEDKTERGTVRIGDAYISPFLVRVSDGEIDVTQVVADLVPCPHTEFA